MKNILILILCIYFLQSCYDSKTKKSQPVESVDTIVLNTPSKKIVERITFDLNNDKKLDTITLYQYTYAKYAETEFQGLRIQLSGGSELDEKLAIPYDVFDSLLIKKYSKIDSRRLLIVKYFSCYFLMIRSKNHDNKLGYLTIYQIYMDKISVPFDKRAVLDSINLVKNSTYSYFVFLREQSDTSTIFKNKVYVIPNPINGKSIEYTEEWTNKLFKDRK